MSKALEQFIDPLRQRAIPAGKQTETWEGRSRPLNDQLDSILR